MSSHIGNAAVDANAPFVALALNSLHHTGSLPAT